MVWQIFKVYIGCMKILAFSSGIDCQGKVAVREEFGGSTKALCFKSYEETRRQRQSTVGLVFIRFLCGSVKNVIDDNLAAFLYPFMPL